jgi:UDP-hydrolysing UDP-N-acetyl-D-glucosamine 2-epimerase
MKRVAVVVTARPSYARLRSLILALKPAVEVQVIVGGSALLERYGAVVNQIESDCGPVAWKSWTVVEGETLETSARSTALLTMELSEAFRHLSTDAVVVHADRHEVLGAAIAARYQELPVIHLQGGEQTGSIDDRVRDAITQLADLHLVSTEKAAARVQAMRGQEAVVTGCPSLDVAREAQDGRLVTLEEVGGDGEAIDLSEPFLVIQQHPTSDRVEAAYTEMSLTLLACSDVGLPCLVFWPGNEAGMNATSKAIRVQRPYLPMRTVRNLPPHRFLKLLTQAACLVGNSSVGIREAGYLGVPVVNLGSRQRNRERAGNVLSPSNFGPDIVQAIKAQVAHGRYRSSPLYGDGHSGPRMAEAILEFLNRGTRGNRADRRVGNGAWRQSGPRAGDVLLRH